MQSTEITPDSLFAQNPKQIEAWRKSLEHRFVLYGGAAGGGKSFFLRWWCVFYLMVLYKFFQVQRAQVILACEDYPTLKDRQIGKIQAEFPTALGKLSLGDTRDFTLADRYGGGRILLRNLDDPSKYLSSEFAGVAVEELTRNKEQTFHDLRLRMRWPGVSRPRFVGATNPGGIGHGWVQKLWIQREFSPELQKLEREFVFVQAKAQDNPFLSDSYYEDLGTLPDAMRAAYLEGRWDLFVGQYFTIFKEARHVGRWQGADLLVKKLNQAGETVDVKTYRLDHERVGDKWMPAPWPKWVSCDWGRKHAAAVYWHATAPDGKHITYREWVQTGLTPRMLGAGIAERSVDNLGRPERIQQFFLSPDAFADRTGESTIAEQIRELTSTGDRLPNPAEASDDRIGGWQLLYSLFAIDGWVISENCVELVKCLPTLIHDDKKVEDVKKVDGDDPADAARYGLYSRLGAAKVPVEVRATKAVQHITNPTERAIFLDKFYEKERRAGQAVPIASRHGGGRRWRPGRH